MGCLIFDILAAIDSQELSIITSSRDTAVMTGAVDDRQDAVATDENRAGNAPGAGTNGSGPRQRSPPSQQPTEPWEI